MGTITGNSAQRSVTGCPDAKVLSEYSDDLRRARILVSLADRMKARGILSPSEHREFLKAQAKKHSLDTLILTR